MKSPRPRDLPRIAVLSLGLLVGSWPARAEPTPEPEPDQDEAAAAEALDRRRVAVARPAMWTLGAWSVANLGVGTVGALATSDPQWRAFHQANAAWNTVNLGIAGVSLWGLQRERPGEGGLPGARQRAEALSLALAFNAGLDVAYLAAGGWLWDRGARREDPRLVGVGHALLVQGSALLFFDLTVLRLHRRDPALWPTMTPTSGGAVLGINGRL